MRGTAVPGDVRTRRAAAVSSRRPPMESRPCEVQAQPPTRWADRAWRKRPRRIKELCGELPGKAGGGSASAEAPDDDSESPSDPSGSGSDTDCFESCDLGSPDPERDPEASEVGSERFGPPGAEPEDSESSEPESSELSPRIPAHRRLSRRTPTRSIWRQREGVRSLLTRATLTPPPPPLPPTQKSRTRAAPTPALESHLHQTTKGISLLQHHPWRKPRSFAGRYSG